MAFSATDCLPLSLDVLSMTYFPVKHLQANAPTKKMVLLSPKSQPCLAHLECRVTSFFGTVSLRLNNKIFRVRCGKG